MSENLVQEIGELCGEYSPNDQVKSCLANIALYPVVGPTAVGKTTLTEYMHGHYDEIHVALGFTTREPRLGEAEQSLRYDFLDHDEAQLSAIHADLELGKLVQCTVHPIGRVYGSYSRDYQVGKVNIIDMAYSEVDKMEQAGFASVKPVSAVCGVTTWQSRLAHRGVTPAYLQARMAQSEESLSWSLGRRGMHWLDLTVESPSSATRLIRITSGEVLGDGNTGPTLAYEMLGHIKSTAQKQ